MSVGTAAVSGMDQLCLDRASATQLTMPLMCTTSISKSDSFSNHLGGPVKMLIREEWSVNTVKCRPDRLNQKWLMETKTARASSSTAG